jgi:hypothetical protein
MKKEHVKYESLSSEIRAEISRRHEERAKLNAALTLEDTMLDWFNEYFDPWLNRRFASDEDAENKRRHYRMDVEVPITVVDTLVASSHDDESAFQLVGNVINISKGGLYFKSVNPIELSSIIRVMINLGVVDRDLDDVAALAMVVRCDRLDESFGVGVMFSSIYDMDKENLETFIFKNLAYYLYSNS